jgi:hypothetical protein
VLHKTISALSAASWEAINRAVVSSARQEGLEDGTMLRIDSTVTQALMHAPYGIELDPHYVDVAIERLEGLPNLKAVHAETGRTFEEIKAIRAQEAIDVA